MQVNDIQQMLQADLKVVKDIIQQNSVKQTQADLDNLKLKNEDLEAQIKSKENQILKLNEQIKDLGSNPRR